MRTYLIISLFLVAIGRNNNSENKNQPLEEKYKTMGTIERFDSTLDNIISPTANAEIIAERFEWSEGPLRIEKHNMLLFSDVPTNTVYKWAEEKGKEIYLKPSGFSGNVTQSKEPGSNGLTGV